MKTSSNTHFGSFYKSPLCIMAFDRHGLYSPLKETGLEMFGCTSNDLTGKSLVDLWPDEFRETIDAAISIVLEGELATFEAYQEEDAETRWWSVRLVPIQKDKAATPEGFMAFTTDITDSIKKSERLLDLRLAEEKFKQYQLILDSMQDMVHITNKDYALEFVNKACESTFGPIDDHKCHEYFHDLDAPCDWCRQDEVFSGTSYRDEVFFKKLNSYYDCFHSPLVKPDGTISKLVILRNINEKKKLEDDLLVTLDQRNTLIREMHHRVKNNLTMLQSLLGLQERSVQDDAARSSLIDVQCRIKAMSLVHERLYRSEDLRHVDAREYLSTLCTQIFNTFNFRQGTVNLKLDIANVDMDIDTLVPLGLIINEMLTNALKYAYPDNTCGDIRISVRTLEAGGYEASVSDQGVGLPEDFGTSRRDSLGMKIINTLVGQINGSLNITSKNGVTQTIKFEGVKV